LLVNVRHRGVVQIPWYGKKSGPVLLWDRETMCGVPLGDGIMGSEEDSFEFVGDEVRIRFQGDEIRLRVPATWFWIPAQDQQCTRESRPSPTA